jgi:predicted RNA-binding Zn-ribbon protein involved in translation (DUF1610 family)
MGNLNIRHAARECVSRARGLIARGDESSVRYACLELRLAIEYITYDQLEVYMKEVPDDAVKKWTPKQVISELLEVDPQADKSVAVAIGLEHTYGVAPPPEEMQPLGEDRRFSLNWANKNHNALGNFLHAPTIYQIESGVIPAAASIIQKATQVADECEKILSSPVFHVNFGQFFELKCIDCGTPIKRRVGSFTKEEGLVCPNSKCRATYDVETKSHEEVQFSLRQSKYTCPRCGTENWVGNHRLLHGTVFKCVECGKEAKVVQRIELVIQDGK